MQDRTEDIQSVVERYPSFDFVPLRIEDAFDESWWTKVSGSNSTPQVWLELSKEGLITDGRTPTIHIFSILKLCVVRTPCRFQSDWSNASRSYTVIFIVTAHANCNFQCLTESHPCTYPAHSPLRRFLAFTLWIISHVALHLSFISYFTRWRVRNP